MKYPGDPSNLLNYICSMNLSQTVFHSYCIPIEYNNRWSLSSTLFYCIYPTHESCQGPYKIDKLWTIDSDNTVYNSSIYV